RSGNVVAREKSAINHSIHLQDIVLRLPFFEKVRSQSAVAGQQDTVLVLPWEKDIEIALLRISSFFFPRRKSTANDMIFEIPGPCVSNNNGGIGAVLVKQALK